MNADLVISVLILWSTTHSFLVRLREQRQHRQPNLLGRTLFGEGLAISFAMLFLTGSGAIVGSYLIGVLSSSLGTENIKFGFNLLGGFIGAAVGRWFIFEKIVLPKFRQVMRDQETTSSPQPPEES